MSLLDTLGDILGGVGNILDMPGSYARGALAGRFGDRLSGRDLLEHYGVLGQNQDGLDFGDAVGFGAEMLLDPLNLAGGFLAKPLARMAQARPLGYGGGAGKLDDIMRTFDDDVAKLTSPGHATLPLDHPLTYKSPEVLRSEVNDFMEAIRNAPGSEGILSEIAPGSIYKGKGSYGIAFETPQGSITRIEPTENLLEWTRSRADDPTMPILPRNIGAAPPGRANIPEVLQPFRSKYFPGAMVEHLPKAQVGNVPQASIDQLIKGMGGRGLKTVDAHSGNFGSYGGKDYFIDATPDINHPSFMATPAPAAVGPNPLIDKMMDVMGYGRYARRQAAGQNPLNPMLGMGAAYNVGRQFGGS